MIPNPGHEQQDGYIRPGQPRPPLPQDAVFPGIRDVPNARRVRAVVASSLVVFLTGVAILVGNSPFRNEVLVPGPLSSAHAHLFRSGDADRCKACHPAAHESGSKWLRGAVVGFDSSQDQSDLCLKCHQDLQRNGHGKSAHNVGAETLIAMRNRGSDDATGLGGGSMRVGWSRDVHGQIACRACHREHHGDVSLTAMSDDQCQVCHQRSFDSFAEGHPEFRQGLVRRRSQIAFDHASHFSRHFPEKVAAFDCRTCHTLEEDGMVVGLAHYETACANCHDAQVQQFADRGLDFLVLPTLDLQAIRRFGLDVGQWPVLADGDFDGALTPMMRLLLEGDATEGEWIRELDADFDFADVDPDDPDQVRQAVRLVWAIKGAVVDISEAGRSAVAERVARAMRARSSVFEKTMEVGVESEAFRTAMAGWFPRAVVEVPLYRAERERGRSAQLDAVSGPMANRPVQEDDTLLAENPLREWMQREHAQPSTAGSAEGSQQKPSPVPSNQSVRRHDREEEANLPDRQPNRTGQSNETPGQELAENPIRKWLNPDGSPDRNPEDRKDLANAGDAQEFSIPQLPTSETSPQIAMENPSELPGNPIEESPSSIALAERSVKWIGRRGGWAVDHGRMAITYQMTGHADPIWVAWADLLARSEGDDQWSSPASRLFLQADESNACRRCHTVDRLANGTHSVNWQFQGRDPWMKGFTDFSHRSHVGLESLADCQACHLLDSNRRNATCFAGTNASEFISNFAEMKKVNCIECHGDAQAGGRCTECHNYHVGSTRRVRTD